MKVRYLLWLIEDVGEDFVSEGVATRYGEDVGDVVGLVASMLGVLVVGCDLNDYV